MEELAKINLPISLYVAKEKKEGKREIIEQIGGEAYEYISRHASFDDPHLFNIPNNNGALSKTSKNKPFETIINFNKLNTLEKFNEYVAEINFRLVKNGLFIGCCETGVLKRKHVFSKFSSPVNQIIFSFYYIFHRVFPKLIVFRQIYAQISRGKYNAMSKVELFGRLYYCGFELISEKEIGQLNYFVVRKAKTPCISGCPTYYPIIKLTRIGKNGRKIKVYKLRTMHPYSEYLQDYIYKLNNLAEGGKIKNDFRISPFGTFMRKLWIDELPMLYNLFKGDMKLFGVRPISEQYYNLYTDELKKLRIRYKPGLIPPYYADLPKTIDEIIESEKKYLIQYEKRPILTDIKYLVKALFNIIFKGNLSN